MPVNDVQIRALKAQAKKYSFQAGDGLCVVIQPTGIKTWVLWYRSRVDGKARAYTIGRYPEIPLTKARKRAAVLRDQVRNGQDPQAQLVAARGPREAGPAPTILDQLAARFFRMYRPRRDGRGLRRKTHQEWIRLYRKNVKPTFGARPPAEVKRKEIIAHLDRIADTRPVLANRVLELIRRLYSFGLEKGELEATPCVGIKKPSTEAPRQRVYSEDELKAIVEGTRGTELEHLVLFVLHTCTRSEETRGARWEEVDTVAKVWTIPAERSKMREPRIVELSAGAVRVLEQLRAAAGRGSYLFPADTRRGYQDHPQKAVEAARAASGVTDFRLHDLTRTVRSGLSELGVSAEVAELCKGHLPPKLVRTYTPFPTYWQAAKQRAAFDVWGAHLAGVLAGEKKGADVLPFVGA